MRKVLFVHDGPIYQSVDNKYYGIDYNTELTERYLYLGDRLNFLIRVKPLPLGVNLSHIQGEKFDVIPVPDFKSVKQYMFQKKKAKEIIKESVKAHEILVIRLPSSIGLIAWQYAIKYSKPYIIELVACPWDGYFSHSLLGKVIAPYMYIKTRKIISKSSNVMYVSENFLQKRYPTNGNSLACSDVILKDIREENLIERINKIKEMNSNSPIILGTVGSIDMKYKGQHYVIKAIQLLKKQGYDIKYHLVGSGNPSRLKKIAKEAGLESDIYFHGPLSHSEVIKFMKKIDIYVQPSTVESHGRVILEAFSTACPVVGSTSGGIPELVESKNVFERKNIKNLASKLTEIIQGDLIEVSQKNFFKSYKFEQNTLNNKRFSFYDDFLKVEVHND